MKINKVGKGYSYILSLYRHEIDTQLPTIKRLNDSIFIKIKEKLEGLLPSLFKCFSINTNKAIPDLNMGIVGEMNRHTTIRKTQVISK